MAMLCGLEMTKSNIVHVVRVRNDKIEYCSRCARLIMNYEAIITGIRGVLDGKIIYWVTRSCCGAKSSIIETSIQ